MTFNQMNYFLTLASCLNFTSAASKLFISQSALSRSISALEQELAVTLLIRDYHNVKLTPAGETLYQEMGGIMEQINEVLAKVSAADKKYSKFVIGVLDGQSVDSKVLFALKKLSDAFPDVTVELRRLRHSEFVDGIKKRNIDVAQTVMSVNTELDDSLDCMVINKEPYYLAARADLDLWTDMSGFERLNKTTLFVQRNISPDVPDITRIVKELCPATKIKYAPDEGTRSLWLESGMGVTICNKNHIFLAPAKRPLKCEELKELGSAFITLIWNKNSNSALLDSFLHLVKDEDPQFCELDN